MACMWLIFFIFLFLIIFIFIFIFYFFVYLFYFLDVWFKFLLIFNFMIFIDFNLYSILSLFYSYFYLYLYLFIYLFIGHEETGRHLFGRKIKRILKRGDCVFRRIARILFPWGNRLQKGRKYERKGIFLQQIWGFFEGGWYIYVREEKMEGEILFGAWGHWRIFWRKSTEKPKRSDCSQGSSRCVPGYTRDSFSCSISPCVRFWMFSILLIGVDAKRPQIVLLILIAYLFVSNLFMICPTSLSPLKKSWNVALSDFPFIIPAYSLPVSSILHYTCFESFLLVPWWLSINVLYEWKFGEEKDREDPVFHPTEVNSEVVLYTN